MDFTDAIHKKIIGVTFVIFSAFWLICLFFYEAFIDFVITLSENEIEPEAYMVFDFISYLLWAVAILFLIPRLIIGIGLLGEKKWANIPGLVFGIISILNVPLGTLLGVYCLLVFTAKDKKEGDF